MRIEEKDDEERGERKEEEKKKKKGMGEDGGICWASTSYGRNAIIIYSNQSSHVRKIINRPNDQLNSCTLRSATIQYRSRSRFSNFCIGSDKRE